MQVAKFSVLTLGVLPLLILSIALPSSAQNSTISGFVYDKSNREALIAANVFLKGTTTGSATNLNGYYVIPSVPAGQYRLFCTYIGYEPFEMTIRIGAGEHKTVDIYLQRHAVELGTVTIFADSGSSGERLFEEPISRLTLSPRQIRQLPQVVEADLLRSLQTLPGIVPVSDYSSSPYVRGGTPDQNLYLIDGADVYNPEHVFGLFSMFNMDAIKNVEIYKGGFGAEYGGRLSSVLNITHLDGNREQAEGKVAISLLAAHATLQLPLGSRGSLSGSLRRTYFDQTVAKVVDDVPSYYFYDGNFKAFFELNPQNRLTISGFSGRDFLDFTFNTRATSSAGFRYAWGNRTGSVRWTTVLSPKLFANFWLTGRTSRRAGRISTNPRGLWPGTAASAGNRGRCGASKPGYGTAFSIRTAVTGKSRRAFR